MYNNNKMDSGGSGGTIITTMPGLPMPGLVGFRNRNLLNTVLFMCFVNLVIHVSIISPEKQTGLRLVEVAVPTIADPREPMTISCSFDMDGEELNSVKWYKDEAEFFRYMPSQHPSIRTFPVSGIHILNLTDSCSSRSKCTVTLYNLTRVHSTGAYRCEISTDAPTFKVVFGTKNVTVMAQPRSNPYIFGLSPFYSIGDFINGNCTVGPADPPPMLTWYLNGKPLASRALVGPSSISEPDGQGLVNTSLLLHLIAEKRHFMGVNTLMDVKCVATSPTNFPLEQYSVNSSMVIGLKGVSNYAQHLSDQKLARFGSGSSVTKLHNWFLITFSSIIITLRQFSFNTHISKSCLRYNF